MEETKSSETSEILHFEDIGEEPKVLKNVEQQLYEPTHSLDVSLDKYLQRPVLIQSVAWTQGGFPSATFSPWHLFFNHTSIKKRIDNYAFVRCDLHIKVVVNASPFYYGAGLISYKPMVNYDPAPIGATGGTTLVGRSQRPHIWVYPQECKAGEMILPFLYHKEWLDITSATALTNMGEMRFQTADTLETVGQGTGNTIDIQIFAWAENVKLIGATVALAVQSDEYKRDGAISKPASAIARFAGALTSVPVIKPFATAAMIAADATANIASLFGFTKISDLSSTAPVKNMPFRGFASSDIGDNIDSLTLDSKNQLTIDSRVIGDPLSDYMLISNLVQHTSYLTQFNWTAAQPYNTLLWNTYITPYMCGVTAQTQQTRIDATPMWLVANMFEFWRGDIIFDFKFICTRYHKGRVRFSWDPIGDISNTPDSYTEVNNQIVDISETTSVSLRVPYLQRVAYLKIPTDPAATIYSASALTPDHSDTINGILSVWVMNEQTSPATSADIRVFVSVRGAENMEFACPKEIDNTISYFEVQSDFLNKATDDCIEKVMGEKSDVNPKVNLVYMGECIPSLRSLLQRTNYSDSVALTEEASATTLAYMYANRRPLFNGFDPNGIHSAIGLISLVATPYNFVKPTPYTLLSPCFVGERGSITWHLNVDGFEETSVAISRSRELLTAAKYAVNVTPFLTNARVASREMSTKMESNAGMMMTSQFTNAGSSAIVPMYSQLTMLETNVGTRVLGLSNVSTDDSISFTWTNHEWKDRGNDFYKVDKYYNAGPDHSLVFFLNVPTLYVYSAFPTIS